VNEKNNYASDPYAVTDDEVQTALEVLSSLKDELKAHAQRRIRRVPDNEAWDQRVESIEWELRCNLSKIYDLRIELRHWISRQRKVLRRNSLN